jgi:hypothetical protein
MPSQRRAEARFVAVVAAGVAIVSAAAVLTRDRREPPAPRANAGPRGRVTVAVYYEGEPLAGQWVVFQDEGGNVLSSARSGTDGKASAEVGPRAMVTVAHGASLRRLYTVMDVKPGDEIVVGEKEDDESVAAVVGTARVRFPGPHPGAVVYTASLGVGATEGTDPNGAIPLPILKRYLVDGAKLKALGEALDARGEPVAFAFAWAPWDEAKTKARAEVDVPLSPWSTAFRSFEIAVTNAPPGLATVDGKLSIFSKDEDRFDRRPVRADVRDGRATLAFRVPPPLGAEALYRLDMTFAGSHDKAVIVRREEAMSPSVVVDLAATALPRVTRAAALSSRDPARPVVGWEVANAGPPADAIVARVSWPETREHVWTIAAPPSATRLVLPALPDELSAWRPDAGPMKASVALVEASFYAGFDDVRRKGTGLLAEPPEDEHGTVGLTYSVSGDLDF